MLRAMATLYYTNVRVLLYLFSLLFCVCLFFLLLSRPWCGEKRALGIFLFAGAQISLPTRRSWHSLHPHDKQKEERERDQETLRLSLE